MLRIALMVLLLTVLLLGVSIGYFNAQAVHFNYLVGDVDIPLIGLLVADFLAAALLTLFVVLARMFGLRAENRRLKRALRNAETELRSLRNLPIAGDKA